MNITVYCGSSAGNDEIYSESARKLGKWIGESGNSLVYGAGNLGLMEIVADAVLEGGGEVTGVIPDVPMIRERVHKGITRVIRTETMAERKSEMIRLGDAFIALPGGTGTFDEITEILSLNCLEVIDAPAVFFNTAGYYEPFRMMLEKAAGSGFIGKKVFDMVLFSDDIDEIAEFLKKRWNA